VAANLMAMVRLTNKSKSISRGRDVVDNLMAVIRLTIKSTSISRVLDVVAY
jgi:hypothetical protein